MNKGADISIFEILNKLGEGGFGSVYKVKRKDGCHRTAGMGRGITSGRS